MATYTTWLVAEQFNTANLAEFQELRDAGRLDRIGWCSPTGRIGEFATIEEAEAWMRDGRNVYANVLVESGVLVVPRG